MSVERLLSTRISPQRRTLMAMRPSAVVRLTAPNGFHSRRAGMCCKHNDRSCVWRITAAAGGGKETRNSRPSVSTLKRKTKNWLEQELRLRGVTPPPGTKADLAAELHAAWELEEVERPAASPAAHSGEDDATGDRSEGEAADSAAAMPSEKKTSGATNDDRSSLTEELAALKVVDLQEQLVAQGLPKSGKKALLVERLVEALLLQRASQQGTKASASGKEMAVASKAKKSKKSSEKQLSFAEEEPGPRSDAPREQQDSAASKGAEDDEEGPSPFQEELERLRKEVREREEALEELQATLLKAESARSVDSDLLAEMQESVRQLQEQRRQWRESLGGRSLQELRASAGEMEARLKPELKAQLEELEAIVEGLEQETALKADVVQQLTESLNRSLAAPSAGKGGALELAESEPKQEGEGGNSDKVPGNGVKDGSTPQQGSASSIKKKTGPGSIGIALAAGVISVLNGWSLRSGIQSSSKKRSNAPTEKQQDE